jgi:FkbM family methyltransferase
MSGLAWNGRVYAFEPSSRNMMFLRNNIVSNHVSNVSTFENALWDGPGELQSFHVEELAGCSFVVGHSDESGLQKLKSVVTQPWMDEIVLHRHCDRVECLRLDDFMRENRLQRLDFVKLDAEGAEIAVINGSAETIRRYPPNLLTEFNPACMKQYFGHDPRSYFELLSSLYPNIFLIENTGALTAVHSYPWLAQRVEVGKSWEDLFCCF